MCFRELVDDGTNDIQYKGRAFKIPELSRWRLMLTSPAQIEELRMAPDDTLSFDEATNDVRRTPRSALFVVGTDTPIPM